MAERDLRINEVPRSPPTYDSPTIMAERDPLINEVPQNLPVERQVYPPGNRPVEEEIHGFWNAANETQRVMKSRHLTMIAIGGTIGTGIFLSAGSSVSTCGPAGALITYLVIGVFVLAMMIILGEMTSMYPVSGAFSTFGTRFVSPALGFTLGWNYWLQWSLAIPGELTAAAVILQYWTLRLQPWHWAIIITVPIFVLQLFNVRAYGESEYWLAMIKVIMIILFIIVGLIYDWGGIEGHPGPGLSNFRNGQAFAGGISALASTNVALALFSFAGVELVAVTAGESDKAYKSVPLATKATFIRIVLFYILTILTIGLCINQNDPTLLNANSKNDTTASPVTVVFLRAGFGPATHVVNAVLLTAVLSVMNSCYYASSRILLAMAKEKQAPRIFGMVNRRGVPVPALLLSLLFSSLTFLTAIFSQGVVFTWLIKSVGISALITWINIGVISIRFRQAYRAKGLSLDDLPFQQRFYPLLPIVVIIFGGVMVIALGYPSITQRPFDYRKILETYAIILLYIVLFCGFMAYEKFKGRTIFVPMSEVNLTKDAVWKPGEKAQIRARDEEEARKEMSPLRRALLKAFSKN